MHSAATPIPTHLRAAIRRRWPRRAFFAGHVCDARAFVARTFAVRTFAAHAFVARTFAADICALLIVLASLLGLLLAAPIAAVAAEAEMAGFELTRNEEGVLLNYAVNVELSHSVDDALGKAVPLYFVAEADIFRSRWYWRDQRVAHAQRIWKIVFQPLTSTYRVTFGGLSQNFDSREEALASITRGARWKLAEPGQVRDDGAYYIEFLFRLDTSLLPRPMQIGIGGQPEWAISVQRNQRIN